MTESEFYPAGSSYDSDFCAEIGPARDYGSEGRFEVTFWRRSNGTSFQITHPTIEKARRFAKTTYEMLRPDFDAQEALREERQARFGEERKAEMAERAARETAARVERMAKITPETPRVTLAVCPHCDHTAETDEFGVPVYECSRCGGNQLGEGANRCESCNVFMAKVSETGCETCGEAIEAGELGGVTGVEVDGVFVPESEIEPTNCTEHEPGACFPGCPDAYAEAV